MYYWWAKVMLLVELDVHWIYRHCHVGVIMNHLSPTCGWRESCNLRLHCFDSWAGSREEKQRAPEQHGRQHLRTKRDARPSTGIHMTRLCHDQNTDRRTSTKQYIYNRQCWWINECWVRCDIWQIIIRLKHILWLVILSLSFFLGCKIVILKMTNHHF